MAIEQETLHASGRPTGQRTGSRSERARLLSLAFIRLLKQKIAELSGLALVVAGGLLGASLTSYFPGDTSWNTIRGITGGGITGGSGAAYNLLGAPGAYVSDIVLQAVGLAGFLAVVAFTVWGIRIALQFGLPRPIWRLFQLILAGLLAAVALAAIRPIRVPGLFREDSGGSIGRLLLERITASWPTAAQPVAILCGISAALVFASCLGVPVARHLRLLPLLRSLGLRLTRVLPAVGLMRCLGRVGSDQIRSEVAPDQVTKREAYREPNLIPPQPANLQSAPHPSPTNQSSTPHMSPAPSSPTQSSLEGRSQEFGPQAGGPSTIARAGESHRPRSLDAQARRPEGSPYELPPVDLLRSPPSGALSTQLTEADMAQHAEKLINVLGDFGVRGVIQSYRPGPVVTLYELEPAPGTKSSRVIGLADDIARSMCAVSVRVAVVPGRNVIGIELPNPKRETVWLREMLEADAYSRSTARLALVLGKDIGGAPIITDLARMPHLLIAGTTGSGKSVGINTMILSLLYRMPPDTCKFIMVDPKMLELSVYDGIPHLLAPVVTDPKRAVVALKWAVREMENRYRAMSKLGVRNIEGFNARLREAREGGNALSRRLQVGFDPDTDKPLFEEQAIDQTELPYIVVVVDEMADLMLVAGKDIEATIQRLAQMARAAGIHLIMATQRPSVDVITGTIKANFPTRISFQVTSKIDSRTILGEQGAEQLLGQGDMLYMAGGGRITRVHGPFVADEEVETIVRFLKAQGEPTYIDAVTEEIDEDGEAEDSGTAAGATAGTAAAGSEDELYDKAVALVCRERKASTSFVQRYLRIGYNSAARLIERMEQEGVIGKANHAGKREVLARQLSEDETP
ncbi:MAG: DNA translocase FtsK 4TM domain-containing protein [Rhodospirillaceae bacterium]